MYEAHVVKPDHYRKRIAKSNLNDSCNIVFIDVFVFIKSIQIIYRLDN